MSIDESGWHATGHITEVPGEVDRIPEFDPRVGEHLWLIISSYRVDPARWRPDHTVHLDPENLLLITGPGCFYCEQPYSERLASRRCRGGP